MDTNVVLETRKAKAGRANQNVVAWMSAAPKATLYLSVITIMELEMGTLSMNRHDPQQAAILRAWLETRVLQAFADRLLPVTLAVAKQCARLHVPDPQPERDALVAAAALVHGMTVVTRNVAGFKPSGVPVLNPWGA